MWTMIIDNKKFASYIEDSVGNLIGSAHFGGTDRNVAYLAKCDKFGHFLCITIG